MPNTFIDNRDRWLLLSEVDYLGQFVKAWLAFNAWYRSAYTETQDRKIINEFKWQPNPVLNKLRPLLNNGTTEEAEQFKSEIGLLHHRLQNYEIHNGKGNQKERVTLECIYLRDNTACRKVNRHQGYEFTVERNANGQMRVEVTNRRGAVIINNTHQRHSFADIEALPAFTNDLSTNLQGYLRSIYNLDEMRPKNIVNLTSGAARPVRCGSYEFRCSPDNLFAGVVEALYLMRCTLFHGELTPTKDSNACYEPAYQIVRRFLDSIS